jgi:trehalose synthase
VPFAGSRLAKKDHDLPDFPRCGAASDSREATITTYADILTARVGVPPRLLREVPLDTRSFALLRGDVTVGAWEQLQAACDDAERLLSGRTLWSISSTERGGGVAEMQRTLLPYWRGAGLDVRWLVLDAPPDFFGLTKRLHNLLHGLDMRRPGLRDRELFDRVARVAAVELVDAVAPGDVVMLQDPQTAGLATPLRQAGAAVAWRCHVGSYPTTPPVDAAWRFLVPYLNAANVVVFTRRRFVPPVLAARSVRVLAPAIDPRSPKNQPLALPTAHAILHRCGLISAPGPTANPRVVTRDRFVSVSRPCDVWRDGPAPRLGRERLVVALARWDRLKNPAGIIEGFSHVTATDARLIIAGPAVDAVTDDPEDRQVFEDVREAWRDLPLSQRCRIVLATLPMADIDENALIVNALQRHAAVIVKNSLQEGFGLGVTEGLWKARPVVATRVGGHQDQIEHRRNGLLIDADSPRALAAAIDELLSDPAEGLCLAAAGRERVRERFLADRDFIAHTHLLVELLANRD